ncbi:MAG: hypothetical protein ABJL67_12280 [Sulfitobacter sp.]
MSWKPPGIRSESKKAGNEVRIKTPPRFSPSSRLTVNTSQQIADTTGSEAKSRTMLPQNAPHFPKGGRDAHP